MESRTLNLRIWSHSTLGSRAAEWLARDGVLLAVWSVKEAADLLWAMTSLHMFEHLVIERRWSIQRYERHLRSILFSVLVEPPVQ